MYRRFTLNPPMVPQTLSDRVEYQTIRVITECSGMYWLNPVREFKVLKNLIDIRLSNLREKVELYRSVTNKENNTDSIIRYCKKMKQTLEKWKACKTTMLEVLHEHQEGEDLCRLLEEYFPRALAKNYLFTVAALFSFDKTMTDFTPDLYFIYDSDDTFETLSQVFQSCQECLHHWKNTNKNNNELITAVNELIGFLENELAIKPLKKVRFNIR